MRRYVNILYTFFRLGVLNELEYRANFFIQIFQSVISLLVSLGGLAIIFDHTQTLNGWNAGELLAVVGVYFLIGGLITSIIQPSLTRFMQDVREGTLDFTLIKPADSQVLVSVKQIQIWKFVDVGLGIVLLIAAIVQLGGQVGLAQAGAFVLVLLAGGAMVYSAWLMLATLAFWFVRVDNILVIFESMYEAGRWPIGIYPIWLRFTLTFLIPIAFAVTVPAEALTGRLTGETLALAVGLGAALLVISRGFWRYGVRNYTGASA